jgi:hypothetical protein
MPKQNETRQKKTKQKKTKQNKRKEKKRKTPTFTKSKNSNSLEPP